MTEPFSQTHELVKVIRDDLKRTKDQDLDEAQSDEEEYDSDDSEADRDLARWETIFERAWAAWLIADEAVNAPNPPFGAHSFGLIALGVLLEVVKTAKHYY